MVFRRLLVTSGLTFRILESPRPAGSTAPTVVLVHGIGMSHRYLSRLHAVLADTTRVVSVDLPGFGGLPKPRFDVSIPQMAAGLAQVVASLDDDRVVLVGHSMGVQWAVETALRHPEYVRTVVTIGPVADDAHRTLGAQARALAIDTFGETPRSTPSSSPTTCAAACAGTSVRSGTCSRIPWRRRSPRSPCRSSSSGERRSDRRTRVVPASA